MQVVCLQCPEVLMSQTLLDYSVHQNNKIHSFVHLFGLWCFCKELTLHFDLGYRKKTLQVFDNLHLENKIIYGFITATIL